MDIICIHCNKVFKSYQSRCNHIRKYHNLSVNQTSPCVNKTSPILNTPKNEGEANFECSKCNKLFRFR